MNTQPGATKAPVLITDDDVRQYVDFALVLKAVERAFVSLDMEDSQIFDVVRGKGGGEDHFFAIKSGRDASVPVLGLKVGSYVPANAERGLQAHSSLTVLIDDVTGRAHAIVEANYLNGLRTAAADALAVRQLARPDSATLGIIGIGDQAVCEAIAVAHVRPIERILAVGTSPVRQSCFSEAVREMLGLDVTFVDAETAARAADILVTATPSRVPVIDAAWIRPGTHVSAMGADDRGKQELPLELMQRADLWVDHPPQAIVIGESQHLYAAGLISEAVLRSKTLGRLLRTNLFTRDPSAITIFDSSGVAVQDLAAAQAALEAVVEARQRASGNR